MSRNITVSNLGAPEDRFIPNLETDSLIVPDPPAVSPAKYLKLPKLTL